MFAFYLLTTREKKRQLVISFFFFEDPTFELVMRHRNKSRTDTIVILIQDLHICSHNDRIVI